MCVATWLAVDTTGYEDVYTPNSGTRLKGHVPQHVLTEQVGWSGLTFGAVPDTLPGAADKTSEDQHDDGLGCEVTERHQ